LAAVIPIEEVPVALGAGMFLLLSAAFALSLALLPTEDCVAFSTGLSVTGLTVFSILAFPLEMPSWLGLLLRASEVTGGARRLLGIAVGAGEVRPNLVGSGKLPMTGDDAAEVPLRLVKKKTS
jgi:hypothetical protein